MQIKFRYTNQEYLQLRKLNHLVGIPKWKSYGMAFLCLLPSFFLTLATQSWIAILSATVLLLSAIAIAMVAALREKKIVDRHERTLTLDDFSQRESFSHSEMEIRWDVYDEYLETPADFRFRRLDRYTVIPKRVVPEHDLAELRSYGDMVNANHANEQQDESVSESDLDQGEPVSVYAKFITQIADGQIYQFRYQSDDLKAAISDPLTIIDESKEAVTSPVSAPKRNGRQAFFGCFWMLVFLVIVGYTYFSTSSLQITGFSSGSVPLIEIAILGLAIALPFVLLTLVNRLIRSRVKNYQSRIPVDANQMWLLKQGWAFGTPRSCQFFDWRDVESFYQNKFCYGLRTVGELIQVIPKRIFADDQSADSFIAQAIGLRREHLRTFETKTTGIETGNPYQPPVSQ